MTPFVDAPQAVCDFAIACDDITPPVGIYHRMWGAATHDQSEAIHRPLRATVAMFGPERSDVSNRQILVSLDHCLLAPEEMRQFRDTVSRAAAVSAEQITVIFSHTHAAGLMSLDRASLPGGAAIPGYLAGMAVKVAELIGRTGREIRPATVVVGTGSCDLARNRDYWDADRGEFVCGYNPGGTSDGTVVVARVAAADGRTIATIVNYACHPTTLAWDNRQVSPDYPGAMRETIENVTGAPCLFVQGASGDLGPRVGFVGDVEVADRNGRQLAYAALSILEGLDPPLTRFSYQGAVVSGATIGTWQHVPVDSERKSGLGSFQVSRSILMLDYRPNLPTLAQVESEREQWCQAEQEAISRNDLGTARDCRAHVERQTRMRARLNGLPPGAQYPLELTTWRMGDLLWLLVPGEHYQLLQRGVREETSKPVIVATLANGWGPSYLPTADVYDTGVYPETIALLAPGSLERVLDAAQQQLRSLAQGQCR